MPELALAGLFIVLGLLFVYSSYYLSRKRHSHTRSEVAKTLSKKVQD